MSHISGNQSQQAQAGLWQQIAAVIAKLAPADQWHKPVEHFSEIARSLASLPSNTQSQMTKQASSALVAVAQQIQQACDHYRTLITDLTQAANRSLPQNGHLSYPATTVPANRKLKSNGTKILLEKYSHALESDFISPIQNNLSEAARELNKVVKKAQDNNDSVPIVVITSLGSLTALNAELGVAISQHNNARAGLQAAL